MEPPDSIAQRRDTDHSPGHRATAVVTALSPVFTPILAQPAPTEKRWAPAEPEHYGAVAESREVSVVQQLTRGCEGSSRAPELAGTSRVRGGPGPGQRSADVDTSGLGTDMQRVGLARRCKPQADEFKAERDEARRDIRQLRRFFYAELSGCRAERDRMREKAAHALRDVQAIRRHERQQRRSADELTRRQIQQLEAVVEVLGPIPPTCAIEYLESDSDSDIEAASVLRKAGESTAASDWLEEAAIKKAATHARAKRWDRRLRAGGGQRESSDM